MITQVESRKRPALNYIYTELLRQSMKYTINEYIIPTADKLAKSMELELVDVELVKENTGKFLRFYIDKEDQEGGIDLDALEKFHRAVLPLMENVEYDYMEVCSPGLDRPLKKPTDYERAQGLTVEIKLYRQINGMKACTGTLVGLIDGNVVLEVGEEQLSFPLKSVALATPVVEIDENEIDAALDGVADDDEDSSYENGLLGSEDEEDDSADAALDEILSKDNQ